mmetsp:Transcript_120510/g.225250  ORF Transcript_120510/g.225250 Transcript_120510/m.225250 type:complete len:382 (+) Transcript_120510:182-1327(+)
MATEGSDGGDAGSPKPPTARPTLRERWEQGARLFKELKRRFKRANYEDYYRIGVWNQQLLELDIEILDQHRRDRINMDIAAPPEMPLVEEIPDSVLPPPPARRTEGPSRVGVSSAGRTPLRPPPRAEDQARILQDFCARWRLDAMRVKLMFANFRPEHREFVMNNFRPSSSDKKQATNQLREYLDDQRARGWPRLRAQTANQRPVHGAPPMRRSSPVIGGAQSRPGPTSRSAAAPARAPPPGRYGAMRGRDEGRPPVRREPPWAARGESMRARPPGGGPPPSGSKRPAPTAIGAGGAAKRSRYGDRAPTSLPSASQPNPPSRAPPPSARPRTPPRQPKPPPGAPPQRRPAGTPGSASASSKRSTPSSVGAKPGDLIKSLLG